MHQVIVVEAANIAKHFIFFRTKHAFDQRLKHVIRILLFRWEAGGVLAARCNFPGLQLEYSIDNGMTWMDYKDGSRVRGGGYDVLIRTRYEK